MNRESWCADKLSKLLEEDLRIPTLHEIKQHFSKISQDEAYDIASKLQLPLVFDCLNDTRMEQIDLACDVLTLCMNNLTLGESTSRYGASLERALYHPIASVKIMALREIYRTASNSELIGELSQQVPILLALVTCVGDEELGVAKLASDILTLIGKSRDGLRQLLIPEIKKGFADTIAISDIVRFRIYELITNIASNSDENLQTMLKTGLISSLVSELDSNDILLRLNVIELLSVLAVSQHGFSYLQDVGVVDKLYLQLIGINEDPLGNLVAPGLLRFFGNIAHVKPQEIYSLYPNIFAVLYEIIQSNDFSILGVALDTLGHIAITCDGKLMLDNNLGPQTNALIKHIGTSLSTITTELRIRCLNCIENLIRILPEDINNRITTITQNWFHNLAGDPLGLIVKYAHNPFYDIRLAGLSVLQAMAEQNWGQEMIKNYPGLVEFLLDRRVENTKESKEVKYAVVSALSKCSIFNEDTSARLLQYIKDGPFYVHPITEVAIEGSR